MAKRLLVLSLLAFSVFQGAPRVTSAAAADEKGAPVLHVVLFTFNDVKPAEEATFLADAKRLLSAVPGVDEVRIGHKAAEDRDVHVKDYAVALYIRFRSKADLIAYGPHPSHQEFANKWRPRFASVRVMDFYSE
jgi:hypothetical protein